MADNENITSDEPVGGAADENTAPQAGMVAQYVKDLSFENPNAPASFQILQGRQPKIDINVNIGVQGGGNDMYEVSLLLNIKGTVDGQDGKEMTAFVCELNYAGAFGVRNLPDEARNTFLGVNAPTLLFPFARRVVADAMRDGGYPPLLLEPINFAALFQQQMQQQQAQAAGQGADAAAAPISTEIN